MSNVIVLLAVAASACTFVIGMQFADMIHKRSWRRMDVILSHCLSAQDYKLVRDQMRKRDE